MIEPMDWSTAATLPAAARMYLRDPDVALAELAGAVDPAEVELWCLERHVLEGGEVWQEVIALAFGSLYLWHGEDDLDEGVPAGSMTSAVRVIPITSVVEVGMRQVRHAGQPLRAEAYVAFGQFDHKPDPRDTDGERMIVGNERIVIGKSVEEHGAGQVARAWEFATAVANRLKT